MKWLQSLVFLVFMMGVGVLLERASIAPYERGSKVDWIAIRKALFENQQPKTIAAIDAPAETTVSVKALAIHPSPLEPITDEPTTLPPVIPTLPPGPVITSEPPPAVRSPSPVKDKATDEGAKGDLAIVSVSEEGTPLVRAAATTLDNQAAQIFMGRTEPQVSGAMRSQGAMTKMVSSMQVGTQLDITPRMERDNAVLLNLKIEDSRIGPAEEGVVVTEPKDGPPIRMPNTEMFRASTTVRLENGKNLLLGSMNRDGKSGKMRLISVTAHILEIDAKK